jgi:Family of unknown function (DUF5706)
MRGAAVLRIVIDVGTSRIDHFALIHLMFRLFFPILLRQPPVSAGADLTPRLLPPDTNGAITAMAKGVNDLLNYYIQVTDTKASIMIAGSVASATFLLMAFPVEWWARVLYICSATVLGIALILATLVVLPRLPARSGNGSVFWGDIASCQSAAAYRDRFANTASAGLLDEEYSALNFYTAQILRRKIRILRTSILCFLSGVLIAIPHHLLQS